MGHRGSGTALGIGLKSIRKKPTVNKVTIKSTKKRSTGASNYKKNISRRSS